MLLNYNIHTLRHPCRRRNRRTAWLIPHHRGATVAMVWYGMGRQGVIQQNTCMIYLDLYQILQPSENALVRDSENIHMSTAHTRTRTKGPHAGRVAVFYMSSFVYEFFIFFIFINFKCKRCLLQRSSSKVNPTSSPSVCRLRYKTAGTGTTAVRSEGVALSQTTLWNAFGHSAAPLLDLTLFCFSPLPRASDCSCFCVKISAGYE